MALITCAECGKEISEMAAACPHCGMPAATSTSSTTDPPQDEATKTKRMLIGAAVLYIVVVAISPKACGAITGMAILGSFFAAVVSLFKKVPSKRYWLLCLLSLVMFFVAVGLDVEKLAEQQKAAFEAGISAMESGDWEEAEKKFDKAAKHKGAGEKLLEVRQKLAEQTANAISKGLIEVRKQVADAPCAAEAKVIALKKTFDDRLAKLETHSGLGKRLNTSLDAARTAIGSQQPKALEDIQTLLDGGKLAEAQATHAALSACVHKAKATQALADKLAEAAREKKDSDLYTEAKSAHEKGDLTAADNKLKQISANFSRRQDADKLQSEVTSVLAKHQAKAAKAQKKAEEKQRKAEEKQRKAEEKQRRTAKAKAVFDTANAIRILKKPFSAGDTGITGWERADLSDGTERWMAQKNTVMFEVTPDKLTVVAGIAKDNPSTAAEALVSMARIGNVAFGSNQKQMGKKLIKLIEKATSTTDTEHAIQFLGYRVSLKAHAAMGMFVYVISKP